MQTTEFKLNASSQAFKILSNSLYEDKEKAVLRELAANAWDAHKKADNPDPIDITLPTEENPYLRVDDKGIGMTKEQLTGIYTTYFSSDKASDDDLIGGFGLGSKSPFAIAEEFTVESVHNGERTVAKAFLDAGSPKLDIIEHTTNNNLPNGTSITVPVNSAERRKSLEKTLYSGLFGYWKVPPRVVNGDPIPSLLTNVVGSAEVVVDSQGGYGVIKISHVILGEFKYKVPFDLAKRLYSASYYYSELNTYAKLIVPRSYITPTVNPILPIGSLELAPSRERIEVTESNYQVLLNAFQSIGKKLLPTVIPVLREVTNEIEKLTKEVNVFEDYKAIFDYWTKLPESSQSMFKTALYTREPDDFPEDLVIQLKSLRNSLFFSRVSVSHLNDLACMINKHLNINLIAHKKDTKGNIKSFPVIGENLVSTLVKNQKVFVHLSDKEKSRSTKTIINHCIRECIPINGDSIPISSYYTIDDIVLEKLTKVFDTDNIVVLDRETVEPYKPKRAVKSASRTKSKTATVGDVLYSSDGIEEITPKELYSLPSSTYIVVLPESDKNATYSHSASFFIKNSYVSLAESVGTIKDILVIELPNRELSNKRYRDYVKANNNVVQAEKLPVTFFSTLVNKTISKSYIEIMEKMVTMIHYLLPKYHFVGIDNKDWVVSLFNTKQRKLLADINVYKILFRISFEKIVSAPVFLNEDPKIIKKFSLARLCFEDKEILEDVVDFNAIGKLFNKHYQEALSKRKQSNS